MSVIGIVRLAPGQVGYFDDVTRIHLTIAGPEKPVVSGMNTINLKRAVKSGRILLTSGSLDAVEKAPVVEPVQEVKVVAPAQTPAETEVIKEESGTVTIDTEAALQKIQEEKEIVTEEHIEEESTETVEETIIEEEAPAEETTVEDAEVEETVESEEVVEEATEEVSTETEAKATAKKSNSKKK